MEVGIGEHDRRILAAHFELDAQTTLAGFAVEPVADFAGAGEGYRSQRRGS